MVNISADPKDKGFSPLFLLIILSLFLVFFLILLRIRGNTFYLKKVDLPSKPSSDLSQNEVLQPDQSGCDSINIYGEVISCNFTNTKLEEIPQYVFENEKLRSLYLENTGIKTVPDDISKLKSLTILYLDDNNLESVPMAITELPNLEVLILQNNKIKEIPEEISNLKNLRSLDLSLNQITEFPKGIDSLENLNEFRIGDNLITNIPLDDLNAIKKLSGWDICRNPLDFSNMDPLVSKEIVEAHLRDTFRFNDQLTAEAQESEGITHLARRVIDKYVSSVALREVDRNSEVDLCLEDYLQNALGSEWLQVGEKRTFSKDLIINAVVSCHQFEYFCGVAYKDKIGQ